jgi:hypothetical protein
MFTSTLSAMPRAYEGMAGHSNAKEFETKICTEATGVPFGRILSFSDGTGNTARLPTVGDTEADFCGISAHINKVPNTDGTVLYNLGDLINCATEGSIFVYSSTAFEVTDPVYVRIVAEAGANEQVGKVGNVTDVGNNVLWARARFRNSGAIGDLAEINIDLP